MVINPFFSKLFKVLSENLIEFAAGQYNDPKYQLGKHEWPALKRMLDKNNSIYSQ